MFVISVSFEDQQIWLLTLKRAFVLNPHQLGVNDGLTIRKKLCPYKLYCLRGGSLVDLLISPKLVLIND